jgi:hypothetical protein
LITKEPKISDDETKRPPATSGDSARATQQEFPRRVPALVVYLHPFRLVENANLAAWAVTIDEINQGSWDYVALHEIVGGVDVGLAHPFNLVIARDGALALPPIPELRNDQAVVEFFNRCLASLLIGGVYCEAIGLDNLETGSIIDWKYVRIHSNADAGPNRFHHLVRMQAASSLEAIDLMNPRSIQLATLVHAMRCGLAILTAIPSMNGAFVLKGATGIARRDWGMALSNLWIVIEQLTSHLWKQHVLKEATAKIDGRKEQLEDTRTWTTSIRQELLFQKAILDTETLANLSASRKARNSLVHRGTPPTEAAAFACYHAVLKLITIALPGTALPLTDLNLRDHSISDPFRQREPMRLEPQFWHAIPKLPGEEELEKEEAKTFKRNVSEV